jgi:hypothetical protein
MGNQHWRQRDFVSAKQSYFAALRSSWAMPVVWVKIIILLLGQGSATLAIEKYSKRAASVFRGYPTR